MSGFTKINANNKKLRNKGHTEALLLIIYIIEEGSSMFPKKDKKL